MSKNKMPKMPEAVYVDLSLAQCSRMPACTGGTGAWLDGALETQQHASGDGGPASDTGGVVQGWSMDMETVEMEACDAAHNDPWDTDCDQRPATPSGLCVRSMGGLWV